MAVALRYRRVVFGGVVVVLLSTIAVPYFAVLNSCLDNAKNR